MDANYWQAQGKRHGEADRAAGVTTLEWTDELMRAVFYDDTDKVPAEWVAAYERGYYR